MDRDLFEKPAIAAWEELTKHVNDEGRLGYVQPVGKDPKPYDENSWHEFGTGAFLLAASEYINFLRNPVSKQPISYKKQSVLYQNKFSTPDYIKDWVLEGDAKVFIKNNWLEMYSPDQKSHHVFWCPKEIPANFIAEWELQNLNTDAGLCIVFFAAKGINGKDVMHASQKKRTGIFKQYTKGDLNNYHISYYTNNPKKPDRPFSHIRKNKGFVVVQYGEKGIPADSKSIHKVQLVKKENQITMAIDGREIINWKMTMKKMDLPIKRGKLHFGRCNGRILDIEI